jgi:hypothetical protein
MTAPKALCSEFNLALYMSSKTLRLKNAQPQSVLHRHCSGSTWAAHVLLTRAQSRFWAFSRIGQLCIVHSCCFLLILLTLRGCLWDAGTAHFHALRNLLPYPRRQPPKRSLSQRFIMLLYLRLLQLPALSSSLL